MIAIEGTDKAGKHTQVKKIVDYLKSRYIPAETLDFPQYNSFFGRVITNYLNGKFGPTHDMPAEYTMMPYALDRLHQQPKLRKWLNEGKWVILDRYTYSNSFSVAKMPREQWTEKINFMEEMEFNQMGIIRPDHNIYLYVDPRISYNMRNQGLKNYQQGRADIHERDLKLLCDVADVYKQIARNNPNTWTVVDEMKSDNTRMNIDEVFANLRPIIDSMLYGASARTEILTDASLSRMLGTNYHNVCGYNFETGRLLNEKYNGTQIYWNDECERNALVLQAVAEYRLPRFDLVAMVAGQTTAKCYPCEGMWTRGDIDFDKTGKYIVGDVILRNKTTGKLEKLNKNRWLGVFGPVDSPFVAQFGLFKFLGRAAKNQIFRTTLLFAGRGY